MGLNLVVFAVVLSCLAHSSYSYQFVAGGRDGWVLNPSEPYLLWASRMRFQVNDTILFKYKSGSDSVLVVNKDAYDKCDVATFLLKLDDGNSVFKFNRSGPFYFISGNKPSCDQGQKLITVVMAVRTPPQGSSPTPSPAAGGGGGAPAPATSPSSESPAPATSPSSASPAPATSPSSASPAPSGGSSEPPSLSMTPADANSPLAPPPRSTASPPCSASMLLMSVVLSVGFGVAIVSPY